jgi:hypothetical protein
MSNVKAQMPNEFSMSNIQIQMTNEIQNPNGKKYHL